MKYSIPEITVFAFFALILGALVISCFTPHADVKERQRSDAREDIISISPEPGVKCFILPGNSSLSPRTMSCVAVPK